jgi:phosphohistidine phosphatase
MDLILWRHAHAEDAPGAGDDLARALTRRGERQAARVGAWLAEHLPEDTCVLCSPALRCQQTAQALGRAYETSAPLAPGADPEQVLHAAGWPDARRPVLIVGHQPTIGETVARLLGLPSDQCPVPKAGVWWLRTRTHGGQQQTTVVAVQSPDTV